MGLPDRCDTMGWMTKWTDEKLLISCLEQETKGIVEKTRSVFKGHLTLEVISVIHAVNTDLGSVPGRMIWTLQILDVIVNKNH
jgi:hypothetical protein